MTPPTRTLIDGEPRSPGPPADRADDWAYMAPMFLFLGCIWAGGRWPGLLVPSYAGRYAAAAVAVAVGWRRYTRPRWSHLWLGFAVGAVGVVQWVGMQAALEHSVPYFRPSAAAFDPDARFVVPWQRWAFEGMKLAGAVLVVPVMEELFWRDWLWRSVLAPNNFKLAAVGEWAVAPVVLTTAAFASVHANWWPTAVVWGAMVAGLLVYTRSLGACVVAHATTNLLLGLYVLVFHKWSLW